MHVLRAEVCACIAHPLRAPVALVEGIKGARAVEVVEREAQGLPCLREVLHEDVLRLHGPVVEAGTNHELDFVGLRVVQFLVRPCHRVPDVLFAIAGVPVHLLLFAEEPHGPIAGRLETLRDLLGVGLRREGVLLLSPFRLEPPQRCPRVASVALVLPVPARLRTGERDLRRYLGVQAEAPADLVRLRAPRHPPGGLSAPAPEAARRDPARP
mmetsp:Transcript_59657/g.168075  ORF Transcript_59657/g.168075 Transcript_59657/m.168075 type:complete len:212 (+) Transcript_59657:1261-1896(+)